MAQKKKNIIHHILLTFFILQHAAFTFSQKVSFQKFELPSEIKTINCLKIENGKTLWIASGSGLIKIKDGNVQKFSEVRTGEKLQVNVIEIDKYGNKWLGSYSGKLFKFKNEKIVTSIDFTEYLAPDNLIITSIAINTNKTTKETKILLSTSDGQIFYYNTITKEKGKFKSPVKNMIYSISYGYDNKIWLCTTDGFYTKKAGGRWKQKNDLYLAYGIFKSADKYWALGRAQNQKAVLMLYYDYDGTTGQKYVWKELQLKKLPDNYLRLYELGFTKDLYAWITSEKGLIRYNPLNGNAKIYSAQKNKGFQIKSVRHIAVQNNETIWVSSSGKSLYKLTITY